MVLWNWVWPNIWFTDPHKTAGIISLQHLRGGKYRDTCHAGMNVTSSLWGPTWSSQVRPFFLYVRPFFLQAQDLTARYTWQWWKRPSQPLTPRSAAHPAVLGLRISIPTPGRCPAATTVSLSSGHCPAYSESTSCLLSSALLKSLEANLCLFSWNLCQYRRCGFYLWIGKIP